jgi:signal transduction histidine kinase
VLMVGEPSRSEYHLRRITAVVSLLAAALVAERELERLRHELHRARQDRALLAAALQHDLRGPLTAIQGSAVTLRDQFEDISGEERRQLLGMIARQSEQLAGMLTESLKGPSAGPEEPVLLRPGELDDGVRRAVSAAQMARAGRVEVDVPPVRVVTDASRIERCLLNLIDNALKYSPPDGVVYVIGGRDSRGFTVTVADTGAGYPPRSSPRSSGPLPQTPIGRGASGWVCTRFPA